MFVAFLLLVAKQYESGLTLIRLGGGGAIMAPLDILCDYSATRKALATTLYDNFLLSFPHILTWNLRCPGVRFRSYVTFCIYMHVGLKKAQKCDFVYKINANWFFHLVHINMLIFTLNGWNEFVLALLFFKKCATNFAKKTTKQKVEKQRNYT